MDYSPQQKAFILKMNQVDAQHRATAQARNSIAAPVAIGGKRQPLSGSRVKVGKPKVTPTKTAPSRRQGTAQVG